MANENISPRFRALLKGLLSPWVTFGLAGLFVFLAATQDAKGEQGFFVGLAGVFIICGFVDLIRAKP